MLAECNLFFFFFWPQRGHGRAKALPFGSAMLIINDSIHATNSLDMILRREHC